MNRRDLTPNDGYLWVLPIGRILTGDTITLRTGVYSFDIAAQDFNPAYNGLTFTGDTFIATEFLGRTVSNTVAAGGVSVPEPSSLVLMGLSAGVFGLYRRRKSKLVSRPASV